MKSLQLQLILNSRYSKVKFTLIPKYFESPFFLWLYLPPVLAVDWRDWFSDVPADPLVSDMAEAGKYVNLVSPLWPSPAAVSSEL